MGGFFDPVIATSLQNLGVSYPISKSGVVYQLLGNFMAENHTALSQGPVTAGWTNRGFGFQGKDFDLTALFPGTFPTQTRFVLVRFAIHSVGLAAATNWELRIYGSDGAVAANLIFGLPANQLNQTKYEQLVFLNWSSLSPIIQLWCSWPNVTPAIGGAISAALIGYSA